MLNIASYFSIWMYLRMSDESRSATQQAVSSQTDLKFDAYSLILEASEQIRRITQQQDSTEQELVRLRRENNARESKFWNISKFEVLDHIEVMKEIFDSVKALQFERGALQAIKDGTRSVCGDPEALQYEKQIKMIRQENEILKKKNSLLSGPEGPSTSKVLKKLWPPANPD